MKKNPLPSAKDITAFKKNNPEWKFNAKNTTIARTFSFANHVSALLFIAKVTVHAEILQHHPDIKFTYAKAHISLTTHDLKTLSKLDLKFAAIIDNLAASETDSE